MIVGGRTFRALAPRIDPDLLPQDMAQSADNCNLLSGKLDSFKDSTVVMALPKSATINSIYLMNDPVSGASYWLQWKEAELRDGADYVFAVPGPVPGDPTARTFVTGQLMGPAFTNIDLATNIAHLGDASASNGESGFNTAPGQFPYIMVPLGVPGPTAAPTASGGSTAPSTTYPLDFAAPRYVNSVQIDVAGINYKEKDICLISGGTLQPGMSPASIIVNAVDGTGAPTDIAMFEGGFYTVGGDPASNEPTTGGSGTGLTLKNIISVDDNFNGWTWTGANLSSRAIGGTNKEWVFEMSGGFIAGNYSAAAISLSNASEFTYQADFRADDNGGGWGPDMVLQFCGAPGSGWWLAASPGIVLSPHNNNFRLMSVLSAVNNDQVTGTQVQSESVTVNLNTWYRVTITGKPNVGATQTTFDITATVATQAAPGTILATVQGNVPYVGDTFFVGINHRAFNPTDGNVGRFMNGRLQVLQSQSTSTIVSKYWVYTWVNSYSQESKPSPPSNILDVYPNSSDPILVSIPAAPTGQDIASAYIYRSVQMLDGSTQLFYDSSVTPSTSAPTVFTDTLTDAEIANNGTLKTQDWDVPPSDLDNMLALPDGRMCGSSKNNVYFSVPNYPHAWRQQDVLTTNTYVTGLGAIDTTVTIFTKAEPYIAFGNFNDGMQMAVEKALHPCLSNRGICFMLGVGVLFPSTKGYMAYASQGNIINLTERLLTPDQWRSLNPSSIKAVSHDGYCYFFYNNGSQAAGYILDINHQDGFGLVQLDFYPDAAYVDPITDTLYFVVTGTNTLKSWDTADTLLPYSWKGKLNLLSRRTTFQAARVRCADYSDVTMKLYADGNLFATMPITGPHDFTIPAPVCAEETIEVQFSGTSRVRDWFIAEDVEELKRAG